MLEGQERKEVLRIQLPLGQEMGDKKLSSVQGKCRPSGCSIGRRTRTQHGEPMKADCRGGHGRQVLPPSSFWGAYLTAWR